MRIILILASSCLILLGVLIQIGWIFNIHFLVSIRPEWVAMKFTTAICFCLLGSQLIAQCINGKNENSFAWISGFALSNIVLCASVMISGGKIFDSTDFSDFTPTPGTPSLAIIVLLFIIAIEGIYESIRRENCTRCRIIIGYITIIGAVICFSGYLLNQPILFYYIDGVSTAMAFHSGVGFLISGLILVLSTSLNNDKKEHSNG